MWSECVKDHFCYGKYKDLYVKTDTFWYSDDAKIRFNDSDIVTGGRGWGYNAWLKGWEEIDFETVSNVAVGEIQQVIQQIILCLRWKKYDLSDKRAM